MSSTGECIAPRLSRHATSSDTSEFGVPRSGATLSQLTVVTPVGDDSAPGIGPAASEQAEPSTPTPTMLKTATPLRTFISAASMP
ncbi:MAG: hypothetical protein ACRDTJ_21450 [Pseudonocardiaceae bacterium]